MLSNTATPRYYGEFRDKVLRGEILVNNEVSMEMNRIDKLIRSPEYYYDDRAMDGFVKYCEGELTLTDGGDLSLLFTFKLWAEQIFCWYYFIEKDVYIPGTNGEPGYHELKIEKKRLTTKQYLIVARGAAKSMYAFAIQAYFLNVDTSTTQQIQTARTMKLADEVMAPFRTSIARARGPLFKFLTQGSIHSNSQLDKKKLAATKRGIENFLTNSILEVRPMTISKLQGLRPKITTIDEWLSGDLREDVVGAIEQGASKLDDYLIVAISSEGTVRNGSGDTIKMELASILKGEYDAPYVSIWHYKLDSIEEVPNPETWIKAQPNIGITVSYETYQRDVERAEKAPAARNDILAKRFGIPMEGYTYFFTYDETLPHTQFSVYGAPCAMGVDLSQGDDFCAFTFMFPQRDGSFGIKTRSYITRLTLNKIAIAMRVKYEDFINEGSLIIFDSNTLDMMDVYEDLDSFIEESQYDVRTVGYDPYNAKTFIDRWITENGPFFVEKVPQGARTESVPLGELKTLSEERLLIFDQELMSFAMGNAITIEDTNGNRKLSKRRHSEKIDNFAALLDAYVAYKLHPEALE